MIPCESAPESLTMSIVIVDYNVGNLRSVQKGFERVGANAVISRDSEQIAAAPALVLPGVGAFGECMNNLRKYGLLEVVKNYLESGRPFLGICVGYQLLFEESEEFGRTEGLGALKGRCIRFSFQPGAGMKIPHMGWNQVRFKNRGRLFDGVKDGADFYFVHSYYPKPEEDIVTTTTEHGDTFASSIEKGEVFGVQFHPEKSQKAGLRVLENFARIAG